MLDTLHRIVQEVNAARGLPHALGIIVRRVAEAMDVDVCSVYLVNREADEYVLMATVGLNPDAVGKVRLRPNEGLVGLVGQRAEPINLDNADQHPRFRYFPETGEERFHAFLGVPIIHFRQVLGVLVVQQQAARQFDDDEVAFLMTMAAQLSGAIAHSELNGGIDGLQDVTLPRGVALQAIAGAPGVAIGKALVVYASADLNAVPDRRIDNPEQEVEVFLAAVQAVREEVRRLADSLAGAIPAEEQLLFDAYLRMLSSGSVVDETVGLIRQGNWAPGALRETINKYIKIFTEMEDPYLSERASDIRDIGRRLLMRLQMDSGDTREVPPNTVLVGYEISASQLIEIPRDRLVGIMSVRGSGSSHAAILARALGVPAVMGVGDLPVGRLEGKQLIVDGYAGRAFIEPPPAIRQEYRRLIREEAELTAELRCLRNVPAETADGVRLQLYANTGLVSDLNSSLDVGCDGIGLHRTEFPFMVRDRFPGEEEQVAIYRQVLAAFAPRPVVLRTLDVGGDKPLPYFPVVEDNPFLGWRGIRLTLDHPEIFLTQLRAMLRANVGLGNLRVMFPMISHTEEVDQAIALLERAYSELRDEGHAVELPQVGVMIEVPAAIFQAADLARRVDFVSVGTNDLTQYLLAVDRNNPRVAKLYDDLHPAVLRALWMLTQTVQAQGKPVAVCGSMAGDPAGALLLIGMGVDSLSMSAASILRVKWAARSIACQHMQMLLAQALELETAGEVRALLNATLEQAGLGGLVRAGR
ncbi:MAG TPA: phosphoenolpyruvate--protein phosphotransferase [Gammaproteobacteria bacterium]|nr:phosphoenolpyruvate--protein phosphotransferase [Gammaproteobacteria bacterium]